MAAFSGGPFTLYFHVLLLLDMFLEATQLIKFLYSLTEMGVMPEIAQAVEELDWL